MAFTLSRFGRKFSAASGIVNLMDDLGSALAANPDMLMLGGGTPARVPAAEAVCHEHLASLVASEDGRHRLLGRYQGPLGDEDVRERLAALLASTYGWPVERENIAISNGGQSAFGILANMLAGSMPDGTHKRIHFPLVPEYLGYADAGLAEDFFSATRPAISFLPERRFKYHIDFDALQARVVPGAETGALCLSRPTNPSGNVLPVAELQRLDRLAVAGGIPLIVDAAYGVPFPGLQYFDQQAYWSDNVILLLSLSKLGMPGLRSGFVIGHRDLVAAFARANTILNLASGNLGPLLALSLMENGDLQRLGQDLLRPWYVQKSQRAQALLMEALAGVPCYMHVAEGAFFLWLWFPDLPIATGELYRRLRSSGVLVIPGDAAFPGLAEDWPHSRQCIRLSYAVDESVMQQAAAIIGRELTAIHAA